MRKSYGCPGSERTVLKAVKSFSDVQDFQNVEGLRQYLWRMMEWKWGPRMSRYFRIHGGIKLGAMMKSPTSIYGSGISIESSTASQLNNSQGDPDLQNHEKNVCG